jgi:hypothetical protein
VFVRQDMEELPAPRRRGRRPKVRHLTLEAAKEEARRIAADTPGADVWVIDCRTVETVRAAPLPS